MEMLQLLIEFLGARHTPAYLVGGWVRDRLLGRAKNRDIDIALDGDAIGAARAFANAHGGAFYLMDEEHQVARAIFGKIYADFAMLRGEVTSDLAERDFTINAMALPISAPGLFDADSEMLASALIDPFHGLNDLHARLVRGVSDVVFRNDPVRLLRALRVASDTNFAVEPHTEALIRRDASLLASASMERARDEFFKILASDQVVDLLRQMSDWSLLTALLPEVTRLQGIEQSAPHTDDVYEHSLQAVREIVGIQADGYADVAAGAFAPELQAHFAAAVSGERARGTLLRLIGLLHDTGKFGTRSVDGNGRIHFYGHEALGVELADGVLRRLRMSNAELQIASRVIAGHLRPPQLARERGVRNRAIYRFYRDTRDAGVDICVLALADTRAKVPSPGGNGERANLTAVLTRLLAAYYDTPNAIISPPRLVDGSALSRELKLAAGPIVGELLERIREAQADGEVSSREEALMLARKILHDGQAPTADRGRPDGA